MDKQKPVKLFHSFIALKDEYQKDLFLKYMVNMSARKIDELEITKRRLEREKRELKQVMLLKKKLTEELREKNQLLENYSKKLETEVDIKTQKILKNERLSIIGKLAASLAHDLRNPLNIIKNSVEIIREKSKNNIDESQKKYFDIINQSVQRISHQIDEVMDFVRVSPLNLESHSVCDLLNNSIKQMLPPENIKIIPPSEVDVKINCDIRKIETVFVNILLNAIQAIGSSSGKISTRMDEEKEDVLIHFQDTGTGIPDENLSKIFEPLFTTKQKGTGLGLSACKTIVEQHGGTITVKNNPTTFTVKLPKRFGMNVKSNDTV